MPLQNPDANYGRREQGASSYTATSENQFPELTAKLAFFGLTYGQAKVYLFLLGRPPIAAHEIVRDLGMHRVEIYRKLRDLEEMGVIETYLDSPKRFSSLDPKAAITALVNRSMQRVSALKIASTDLVANLDAFQESRLPSREGTIRHEDASVYKIGQRRARYFDEITALARNAREEIIAVTTRNGVIRAYMTGFLSEYEKAAARDVSIRMVTEIDEANLKYAKKFSKVLSLRHAEGVRFRLIAADKLVAVVSARFDDSNVSSLRGEDTYFVFRDRSLASAICFMFEHLWNEADELSEVLRSLGGGSHHSPRSA